MFKRDFSKRLISLLLCGLMVTGFFPAGAFAEATEVEPQSVDTVETVSEPISLAEAVPEAEPEPAPETEPAPKPVQPEEETLPEQQPAQEQPEEGTEVELPQEETPESGETIIPEEPGLQPSDSPEGTESSSLEETDDNTLPPSGEEGDASLLPQDVELNETEKVRVVFMLTPEDASLEVYMKDEQGEKTVLQPEEDGSYSLLSGIYYYSVSAEGFAAAEEIEFQVPSETEDPLEITVELLPEEDEDVEVMIVAASGECGDDLIWELDDAGVLTISGTGAMWSRYSYSTSNNWGTEIKKIVINSGVTSIGDDAFSGCSSLTSVEIPDSVTSIGNYAFSGCKSLTSVTIPDSVTSIGYSAFHDCTALKTVNITDIASWSALSFRSASDNPLYYAHALYLNGTEIKDLVIPGSVTAIGDNAFTNCNSLRSVTLEEGITKIGNSAFSNCDSLTKVTIPDSLEEIGNSAFYGNDGVLNRVTISPNSSLKRIGGSAFYYQKQLTVFNFPYQLQSIGSWAFYYTSSLLSATLPDSLTEIGEHAFESSGIQTARLPARLAELSPYTFYGCSKLKEIELPEGLQYIGSYAFYGSGLESVSFPDSLTSVDSYAFSGSYLKSIDFNNVTRIGDYAFASLKAENNIAVDSTIMLDLSNVSNLGTGAFSHDYDWGLFSWYHVVLNPDLQVLPDNVFKYAKIASITLPEGLREIGFGAFRGARLDSITLPSSLEEIVDYAFSESRLTRIEIPDGATAIGPAAFKSCAYLVSAVIPESVTSIGQQAFADCPKLTIYGKNTSEAKTYATSEGIPFKTLDQLPPALTGLKISKMSMTLSLNNKLSEGKLTVSPIPANAEFDQVSWTIDRNYVDLFTESGGWISDGPSEYKTVYIRAYKAGTATVTASSGGYSVSCTVTVVPQLTGIDLPANIFIPVGETETIQIAAQPSNASLDGFNFTWKNSAPKVLGLVPAVANGASVRVTGLAPGTSTLTVSGDGKTAQTTVTVIEPPAEALTLFSTLSAEPIGDSELYLPYVAKSKLYLYAEKTPASCTSQIGWSSSVPGVASVDSKGTVELKAPGVTVITAAALDPVGASASVTLRVVETAPFLPIKSLTVNSYLDEAASFELLYPEGSTLESAELLVRNGKNYEATDALALSVEEDDLLAIRAASLMKKTFDCVVRVRVYNSLLNSSLSYDLPLKISVINTAPKVKVKLEEVNTYYPENSFEVSFTVTGGQLDRYRIAESSLNPYFELDSEGRLILTDLARALLSGNPKASLTQNPILFEVFCVGGRADAPIQISAKPAVINTAPNVKFTGLKVNAFYRDHEYSAPVSVTNGAVEYITLAEGSSPYFDLDPDTGTLSMNALGFSTYAVSPSTVKGTAVKLSVKLENVDEEVIVSGEPSISVTKPKLVLLDPKTEKQIKALSFSRFLDKDRMEVLLFDAGLRMPVSVDDIDSDQVAVYGSYDGSETGLTGFYCDFDAVQPAKVAFTLLSSDWAEPVVISVPVTYEKEPEVTLKATGKLDLLTRKQSCLTLTPVLKNCSGTEVYDMELLAVYDARKQECDTSLFDLVFDAGLGKAFLYAENGEEISKAKYTLDVLVTLNSFGNEYTVESRLVVSPIQSSFKLMSQSSKLYVTRGSSRTVFLYTSPKYYNLADLRCTGSLPDGITVEVSNTNDYVTIYADSSMKTGTYSLKFEGLPENAAAGTKYAVVTVKVTIS